MKVPDRSMMIPDNRTNEHTQPPAVCSLEQFRSVNGTTEFTSPCQYDGPIITTIQYNHSFKHYHTMSNTFQNITLSLRNMDIPAKLHLEQGATDKDFAYHLDALGSVRLLSDSSKDTAVSYTYLPYGESTLTSGTDSDAQQNRYRFTAREFEQPHFTYYRSRYYANRMGRFLKKDTFEPDEQNPLTFNKYLYVVGNPVNYYDPFGESYKNLKTYYERDQNGVTFLGELYYLTFEHSHGYGDRAVKLNVQYTENVWNPEQYASSLWLLGHSGGNAYIQYDFDFEESRNCGTKTNSYKVTQVCWGQPYLIHWESVHGYDAQGHKRFTKTFPLFTNLYDWREYKPGKCFHGLWFRKGDCWRNAKVTISIWYWRSQSSQVQPQYDLDPLGNLNQLQYGF